MIVPFARWLLVAVAAVLFFFASWIVVPGWTYPLLVLSVVAPEYSAWLLIASLLVSVLAVITVSWSRLAYLALGLALSSAILASIPLVRVPSTVRRFDAEMTRAFGPNVLAASPDTVLAPMRAHPVAVADLFRGIDFGVANVVHDIPIGSAGGQSLSITVYRPNSSPPFPVIVQIYGGAWQRGTPENNAEFARYLAAHGYIVFAIDYRHAPRWPWPAQLTDVHMALDWIHAHAEEYSADVSRLAVMGRSSGAQLALLAAYAPVGPPVRGVVSYYSPVDLAAGYRRPPKPDPLNVRAIDEAFLSGTPDQMPAAYRDASPITYVTRPLPPTLLLYGGRDHVVEARFARILHERLLVTGTRSAFLDIPWAEHAFDAVPSGLSGQIALYYTERFLAWALRARPDDR